MKSTAYIKTGTQASRKRDIDQTAFKDMSSSTIVLGGLRELYRRYSAETWAFAFFGSWAVYVWVKIG